MKLSLVPLLFLIQCVVIYRAAQSAYQEKQINLGHKKWIGIILAFIGIWGILSSWLAINDFYAGQRFLSSLPGLWITQIPVLIVMIPWIFSQNFRVAIGLIISHIPLHRIMAFEGLRVLAIGGIFKGFSGEFSLFYAQFVGMPDFIFGVVSLLAAVLIYQGVWNERAAVAINWIGFLIIVPFGMVLINVGLPGPLHMIYESPGLETIFQFPMALAPTLVVPVFVLINSLVAWELIQKCRTRENQEDPSSGFTTFPTNPASTIKQNQ